jgi:DNA-binding NarL/FixJ family response regulator
MSYCSLPPGRWHHALMPSAPKRARTRTPGSQRQQRDTIKILIADDHRTFAEALKTALAHERGLKVTGMVHDGQAAVEISREKHPDIVLMDVSMPRTDGIAATREIKREQPDTRVVMLSAYEEEHTVARAIDAGASGFLSKMRPMKDVARSIRAAYRGEPLLEPQELRRILRHLRRRRAQDAGDRARVDRLSRRQTEILQGLADGLSPEQLSEKLGISRNTVRTHVQNILFKLKVHSRLEALALAIRHGKIYPGEPV